jgi:hypothetical protein
VLCLQVTCDSLVKMRNSNSKLNIYLHSHEVAYGSGSGQQSVTGAAYWSDRCNVICSRATADALCSANTDPADKPETCVAGTKEGADANSYWLVKGSKVRTSYVSMHRSFDIPYNICLIC